MKTWSAICGYQMLGNMVVNHWILAYVQTNPNQLELPSSSWRYSKGYTTISVYVLLAPICGPGFTFHFAASFYLRIVSRENQEENPTFDSICKYDTMFSCRFSLKSIHWVMMLPSLSKSLEQAFTITVAEPMNFRGWANRQQPAPGHKGNRCETHYLGDSLGFVWKWCIPNGTFHRENYDESMDLEAP